MLLPASLARRPPLADGKGRLFRTRPVRTLASRPRDLLPRLPRAPAAAAAAAAGCGGLDWKPTPTAIVRHPRRLPWLSGSSPPPPPPAASGSVGVGCPFGPFLAAPFPAGPLVAALFRPEVARVSYARGGLPLFPPGLRAGV